MNLPERYYPIILLAACTLIFLPHLGVLPVNIMEARNFVTAREMLHDHHWILTTFNGEPRYEKPPLPTWITAVSAAVFGLKHMAALRLPAVLMAVLLAFMTYILGKKLTNNPLFSLISSLILVTSFYILWSGRNGQWDIFTHGFMMAAIYQFHLFLTIRSHLYKHALLAGLFLGLSFMSKGPVSLYALFLPYLISFGLVYRFGKKKSEPKMHRLLPLTLLVIVTIFLSGWWYFYTYFHDTQVAKAITSEEVSNWNSYNVRPFYYYWNFFIQSGTWTIIALVSLIYPYLRNRVSDKRAYTFTFIWTISAVVLLSLIPEKKPRYLLPVIIPLAMNMGFYMEYLFHAVSVKLKVWEKLPVWTHFGLIAVVSILLPFGGYWYLQDNLDGYWIWFVLLSASLLVIGILIFNSLRKWLIDRAFYLTIAFMCATVVFGLPLSKSITVNPEYKSLSLLKNWQDSTEMAVYEFREATPELIWAYGNTIPVLHQQDKVIIPSEDHFGLLAFEELEKKVRETFKEYQVEKTGYYDMSPRGRDQGGHKGRLYRDLYVIEKK